MTVFFRLLDVTVEHKGNILRAAVRDFSNRASNDEPESRQSRVFVRDPAIFATVPGRSFLYWMPSSLLRLYRERNGWAKLETRCGLGTLDDFQFLRAWWELGPESETWHAFAKGGSYAPWYTSAPLSIDWKARGQRLKASVEQKVGSASRKIQGEDHYFLPGVTWPRLPHNLGSFQVLPADSIYSDGGPAMFADGPDLLLFVVAVLNSAPYLFLLDALMPRGSEGGQTLKYETGYVTAAPLPLVSDEERAELIGLARRGWSRIRELESAHETSRAFLIPVALRGRAGLSSLFQLRQEVAEIQSKIDDISFRLYGIGREDREHIEAWCAERRSRVLEHDVAEDAVNDVEAVGVDASASHQLNRIEDVLSWAVGVVFGRFDERLISAERALPVEPAPFEPLPRRPPGMWPRGEKPTNRPDILVDDEGHPDDISARVIRCLEQINYDAPDNMRQCLATEFFSFHIKMYSKSRRKAPIYWQLSTPSTRFSVWLHADAFTKDTLFRVQNDYVAPKLAHEERRLEAMALEHAGKATAAERKALAAQNTLIDELRSFMEEVKRVAPLWNPNYDDGVIVNFAPLWRLVPHNKHWQKEVRATWGALCEGNYDWTHLAMRLWPERVVPKCAIDQSLAIAHGLQDIFWTFGSNGKSTPRKSPTRSIDELVSERMSAAAKGALKSLLEASPSTGTSDGVGRRGTVAREKTGSH